MEVMSINTWLCEGRLNYVAACDWLLLNTTWKNGIMSKEGIPDNLCRCVHIVSGVIWYIVKRLIVTWKMLWCDVMQYANNFAFNVYWILLTVLKVVCEVMFYKSAKLVTLLCLETLLIVLFPPLCDMFLKKLFSIWLMTNGFFICRCSQMKRKGNSMTLMVKMDSKRVTMVPTVISSQGWFHEILFDTSQQKKQRDTIFYAAEK